MKIRYDFVTNSSSSSFIVKIGVILTNGEEVQYEAFAEDDGGGVDYGEVRADRDLFRKAATADSIEDLISLLENGVGYYVPSDDWFSDRETSKRFDSKDFALYEGVDEEPYTKEEFERAVDGFDYEGDDDPDDGRSVPYAKGVVKFDKGIKKRAGSLDDIKSVFIEEIHTASGEYIEYNKFPGLEGDGLVAESIKRKVLDLKTGDITEDEKCRWN